MHVETQAPSTLRRRRRRPARRALRAGDRGMTLIEILVVLAIIGMIVGGIAVSVFGSFDDAKVKNARNEVLVLEGAAEQYMALKSNGKCPKDLQELKAAGELKRLNKDPWANDYQIDCSGEHGRVGVFSWGPDGKAGSEDDITSWADAPSADDGKKKK